MMPESPPKPRAGPLSGIRVLDLTRVLAGPFCSMVLGDLGAEIIKIEDCNGGDMMRDAPPAVADLSHYFLAVNRNKKSVALNLKTTEGREIFLRMLSDADIVLENFRPGVMDSLGLSVPSLRERNKRIIVCSISGFGQTGSLKDAPAYDIIAQAMSGVMGINGEAGGGPLRMGIPMGDIGGGLWALVGVLSALQHRHSSGEGLHVDISLLEGLIAQLGYMSQLYFFNGQSPTAVGNGHQSVSPYGCYPVRDGDVVVAAMTPQFFENFCHTTGREELLSDPRFIDTAARKQNRLALEAIVADIMKAHTRAEWTAIFERGDVPCAAVLAVGEALEQPIVRERDFIKTVDHPMAGPLRVVDNPVRYTGRFTQERHAAPPGYSEHTAEILKGLGFGEEELLSLEQRGVIKITQP
jgi:crotonobetainyl-CoA:carnitine CoA-transferase CaiB-like acyl-CoA transferase